LTALEHLNSMPAEEARALLQSCCGSLEWVRRMVERRPFQSEAAALDAGDRVWKSLFPRDWLEAFRAHPRIGDPAVTGRAGGEQAGTRSAPEATLSELARANRLYEERFGHIYIVCASGLSAEEMLDLCRRRLHNDRETELAVAAEEQGKITRLRLGRLFVR
jgi:OHCU decarboxylase